MSLKERIEKMKLPGHNGPAIRVREIQNKRLVVLLSRKIAAKVKAQEMEKQA